MTTVTANFGTHTEIISIPDGYTEDAIEDFFAHGALTVTTRSEALV